MSVVSQLVDKGIAKPPRWLPTNVHYETIMGSVAYGVSADTSDMDVYGFAIPHKDDIFPHLRGEIPGFGRQKQNFEQYQEHHLFDKDAMGGHGRNYDLCIYSIVKYFQLAMENNPNVVDSLFTPASCVLHCSEIGNMVREKRRLFLHKGCWPKFKGYSYSQLHKIETRKPSNEARAETVEKHGMDTKFAYHVVRLLLEVEQILTLGDIDLQRDREQLKAVRCGEWTLEQLKTWATQKEASLEQAYADSKLSWGPDEPTIKQLLLDCLEHHFGSLANVITLPTAPITVLRAIDGALETVRHLL